MGERDDELARIAQTYRDYRETGRNRRWDLRNPGYARMVRDRDGHLVELIRASTPPAGSRVLDLGCGDGSLAVVVQAAGLPVTSWTGIDLDASAVEHAQRAIPWAAFVTASADRLPFDSASYEIVVASTLFSSLLSPGLEESVAREIARVIRPEGWLVYYDLRYNSPQNPAVHGIRGRRLAELFPSWRRELRTLTLLPPLARRLGRSTPVAYPVLHALPPLRSHLIGRLSPSS